MAWMTVMTNHESAVMKICMKLHEARMAPVKARTSQRLQHRVGIGVGVGVSVGVFVCLCVCFYFYLHGWTRLRKSEKERSRGVTKAVTISSRPTIMPVSNTHFAAPGISW